MPDIGRGHHRYRLEPSPRAVRWHRSRSADLAISQQTIYLWRRQHLIDTGQPPGTTSSENAELIVARRRIAELEAAVAIHRRAAQLLDEVVSPKDQVKKLATELATDSAPPLRLATAFTELAQAM
jgi:transposase-like protein